MILPEIYDKPADLSPLLEACYEVAAEAHKTHVRYKKQKDGTPFTIPYITHPNIVYKVLHAVGITDPSTLGAAFLHDVMEDNIDLLDPKKLQASLARSMAARGVSEPEAKAFLITSLCVEVKNDAIMREGKRFWQRDHAHKLSLDAKQLKIADQIANFIDDIVVQSGRSQEALDRFYMKALECYKGCSGKNPLLDNLFKVTFDSVKKLSAATAAGDKVAIGQIREGFSLEGALEKARRYKANGTESEEPVLWKKIPEASIPGKSIIAIGLGGSGKICRFVALVDPHLEENEGHNHSLGQCIEGLEKAHEFNRITTLTLPEIKGDHVVRTFKIKPSMDIKKFISIVRKFQPITEESFTESTPVVKKTPPVQKS